LALVPGPDYPGGGQIISSAGDIADAYRTGRGSLKVRARWKIEDLARGQWQLVVTELPPGVSTQRVLEEIEELTNPKVKAGKKALSQDQTQLKASVLAVLDVVRDESNKDAAVRLVFEPKTSRIQQELITRAAGAHQPGNLVPHQPDHDRAGRPAHAEVAAPDADRVDCLPPEHHRAALAAPAAKVLDRIHILEGRQLVLLNIDEVIAIIRQSDEPKAALIARFSLSDRQAEDILEIRLRQLARLEAIKIEQELAGAARRAGKLEEILGNPAALRRLMVKEIEADAKTFADARRTLIQAEKKAVAEVKVVDEPVTVVVSGKRAGCAHAPAMATRRPALPSRPATACTAPLNAARWTPCWCLAATAASTRCRWSLLPGGRGDGQPITTLIELEAGTQLLYYFAGPASATLLLSGSGGYGFLARWRTCVAPEGGKAFHHAGTRAKRCARRWSGWCHTAQSAAAAGTSGHACGLRVHGRAHPDVRDRPSSRPWPTAAAA
jgi:topoisomerase-4 subunit A